ncbi:hypothetical protein B5807_03780 [Epicoccum nigrum]|uniref:Uncharacterized protein n=1 Tax=Epicoccum nigrum TaxID=105696 RepID=A0A1Y2M6L7_EPING|nr:hypothetical protein B5807_03780 [Epicoccum nigrum]
MSDTQEPPPPPPPPQHNLLISIPRTASNLLTQLLNLPSQPFILPHPRDGYSSLHAPSQRFKSGTFSRPYSTWTPSEQHSMHGALHSSASSYSARLASASAAGKGTRRTDS